MQEFSYEDWIGPEGLKPWEWSIASFWTLDQVYPFVACLFDDLEYCPKAERIWNQMMKKRWGRAVPEGLKKADFDWEKDIDWQAIYNLVFEQMLWDKGLKTYVDKWGAYGFIHPEDGPIFGDRSGSYPIWDQAYFEKRMQW